MHSFPVEYVLAFYNPTGGGPGAMGSRSITRNGMTRRGANIPHPEIKAAAVIASSSRRRRQTTKAEGGRTIGWIYTEHVIGCGAMSTQAGAKLQVSPLLLVACLPPPCSSVVWCILKHLRIHLWNERRRDGLLNSEITTPTTTGDDVKERSMEQALDLPQPGKRENQTRTRAGVYLLVKLTSYPVQRCTCRSDSPLPCK